MGKKVQSGCLPESWKWLKAEQLQRHLATVWKVICGTDDAVSPSPRAVLDSSPMSEFATNGPAASKFVFLKDIASLPPNTKVRLIGWYDSQASKAAVPLIRVPALSTMT